MPARDPPHADGPTLHLADGALTVELPQGAERLTLWAQARDALGTETLPSYSVLSLEAP